MEQSCCSPTNKLKQNNASEVRQRAAPQHCWENVFNVLGTDDIG